MVPFVCLCYFGLVRSATTNSARLLIVLDVFCQAKMAIKRTNTCLMGRSKRCGPVGCEGLLFTCFLNMHGLCSSSNVSWRLITLARCDNRSFLISSVVRTRTRTCWVVWAKNAACSCASWPVAGHRGCCLISSPWSPRRRQRPASLRSSTPLNRCMANPNSPFTFYFS